MIKHRFLAAGVLVVIVLSLISFAPSLAEEIHGSVKVATVNVRSEANLNSSIVSVFVYGTDFRITGYENGFYKTSLNGTTGFVSEDFVELDFSTIEPLGKIGVITNDNVNVRYGPGTEYSFVMSTVKEESVIITGMQNGFYHVKVRNTTGWISSDYVRLTVLQEGQEAKLITNINTVGYVTSSTVNVRMDADASSDILKQLTRNTQVKISGRINGFYRILCDNKQAYVSIDFITLTAPDASASDSSQPVNQVKTSSAKKGEVTSSQLNVRSEPNTNSTVIGSLSAGDKVDILGESGTFYYIKFNNAPGYISSEYVRIVNTSAPTATPFKAAASAEVKSINKTGTVSSAELNVRQFPSTTSELIGKIYAGNAVSITGESGNFYRIRFGSSIGYVMKDYIHIQDTASDASNKDTVITPLNTKGKVTASSVNMRAEANTNSDIITSLPLNTEVEITGMTDSFYRVKYNGHIGYVSRSYMTPVSSQTAKATATSAASAKQTNPASFSASVTQMSGYGTVTASSVNVRENASTESTILLSLPLGTVVEITGNTESFYRVKYNGKTGYIHKTYLSKSSSPSNKPTSTPTAVPKATASQVPTGKVIPMSGYGKITSSTLNLRAKANINSDILAVIPGGTVIKITGTVDTFYQVKYNNKTGYVSQSYITKVDSTATNKANTPKPTSTPTPAPKPTQKPSVLNCYGIVTASLVNMREQPTTDSKILLELCKDTCVQVQASQNGFYKIKSNGKTGYVSSSYMKLVSSTPSPTPKPSNSKYANVTSIAALGEAPGYLSMGSTGEDVEKLQQALKLKGKFTSTVDGKFGNSTKEAINAYQKANGLPVTGKADYATIKKLFGKVSVTTVADDPKMNGITKISEIKVPATTKKGNSGASVTALQQALKIKGYFKKPIDGIYGTSTFDAVTAFQKARGIKADGEAGFDTIKALFGANASNYTYITEELIWFEGGSEKIPKGATFTVKDVLTGRTFRCRRWSGANHMDCEPLTAEDTATMKSIYGGSWSWSRRAILVLYNGHVYAASQNAMPHGTTTIKNNNFDGHFCIHFTGSKTHGSKKVDPDHQAAIKRALHATW